MSDKDYNYDIEHKFAQYGGEADNGVERTCGNCFSYNAKLNTCTNIDNIFETSFYSPQQEGCHCHSTYNEQQRLQNIIDECRRLAEQKCVEDNRRNGTGDCAGCPFRNVNKEMYDLLLDIVTDYQCMPNPAVMADKIEAVLKKARGEE